MGERWISQRVGALSSGPILLIRRLAGRTEPAIAKLSVELGEPDGEALDAAGRYLTAWWWHGAITACAPDLRLQDFLEVPVCQPNCVAFGSKDLDLPAVTTASMGLSQEQLARDPRAGSIFVFLVHLKGRLPFGFSGTPHGFEALGRLADKQRSRPVEGRLP
ncbi:SMP-30/gluconolactonase/LRE family protein [Hyphomonas sp.]|uniref:SMP-30/gluconolactonase/LRE family protein n=1 Tax=Hyphomonas sp. TaxID=87 RepID=UPI0034570A18